MLTRLFLGILSLGVVVAQQDYKMPDPTMTPGAIFNVTSDVVCEPGYTKKVRHVTESEKAAVYAEYGVPGNHEGYCDDPDGDDGCEIDHLIPLELGGSNDITNLWPQPYFGDWNAHIKDKLENFLHKAMCNGDVDIITAQTAISTNWVTAYQTYIGNDSSIVKLLNLTKIN